MITNYAVRALTSDFLKAPFDLGIRGRRVEHVKGLLGKFNADKVAALPDDKLLPFVLDLAAFYDHDQSIDYGRSE